MCESWVKVILLLGENIDTADALRTVHHKQLPFFLKCLTLLGHTLAL